MTHSIRWRVAVWTTTGVLMIAGLAAMAWYSSAAAILHDSFDAELENDTRTLATLTRCVDGGVELEFSDELMPRYLPSPRADYFQLWLRDGTVVERSRSLGDETLPLPANLPKDGARWNLTLPDGRPGRASALTFPVTEGHPLYAEVEPTPGVQSPTVPVAVAMVAASRSSLDRNLLSLRLAMMLVGIALALGAAFVVTVLVGLGLRPLQRLSDEIGALEPGAPPGSLHLQDLPREIVPIAHRLDDLHARMQAALDRERRVAANMAHELRTPVSELQALTEVAVRWPEGEEHRARALATAHAIARRMSALTEAVLRLSRPEPDRIEVANARFDLGALVRSILDADNARRAPVQADIADGVTVTSDQAALRIVLANLIDNAHEHGGDGPIRCDLRRAGPNVEFCISNPAGELTVADLPRLGERFWRGDQSRTSHDRPHFGLGLAIAHELCARIGARLTHQIASGRLEAFLHMPATAQ